MTRRPTVTLVLALAVLAGCSAIGGEAAPTTGRPAVTPAPVADDSGDAPDRSAADAAPGIGPNGSVDLRAVERAHRTRVANRSFEFVIAGNVTSDGGIRGYRYSAAVANESTYRVRFDAGNVTSYRATAYVAPDGLIRTVVVNYRYEGYGDEGEYALRFETRDVGNTTVERPDWVPNATAGETAAPG